MRHWQMHIDAPNDYAPSNSHNSGVHFLLKKLRITVKKTLNCGYKHTVSAIGIRNPTQHTDSETKCEHNIIPTIPLTTNNRMLCPKSVNVPKMSRVIINEGNQKKMTMPNQHQNGGISVINRPITNNQLVEIHNIVETCHSPIPIDTCDVHETSS